MHREPEILGEEPVILIRRQIVTSTVRVVIVVLALLSVGCAADRRVWGFDREKFVSSVYHGEYEFLRGVDYDHIDTGEILRLGNGAPYYMGLIYQRLGMEPEAQSMFRLALDRSKEPWRRAAGVSLVRDLLDNQQYQKASDLGAELARTYTDSQDFSVLQTEALYWMEKDRETLGKLDTLTKDGGPRPLRDPEVRRMVEDGELDLWRTAASVRLGAPDWKQAALDLFERYPASDVHARLYIFLQYRKQLDGPFSAAELSLIEGKYDQTQKKYHDAIVSYEKLMDLAESSGGTVHEPDLSPLLSSQTIEDIGRTYSLLGQFTRGAERLERLASRLSGDARVVALDNSGRLYRHANRYGDAVRVLRAAYALAVGSNSTWYDGERRDRVLWYLLESRFHQNSSAAAAELGRNLPVMFDRSYFSDIEENLLSSLVDSRDWSAVAHVYEVLIDAGDAGSAAGYGVVLAEAIDKGLYSPPAQTPVRGDVNNSTQPSDPSPVKYDVVSLLKQASAQTSDLYYRFLAASALDKLGYGAPDLSVLQIVGGAGSASTPGRAGPSESNSSMAIEERPISAADKLVQGFFEYGLLDEAYARVRELWQSLSQGTLEFAARGFADRENVTESLRTMDLARSKVDFALSPREAHLLYPQAYSPDMERVIAKERLPRYLFYAVVREESYFDSGVASHAGAVGLSQLMPDTAADVAHRMGLHEPNLADPATNLSIGGWYLRNLIDRFKQPVLALAAYNGGLGRVRQWQRVKDLPSLLLFHQSIPLPETRLYIQKILVSAVYYAYLYDSTSLTTVVSSFFPEFMSNTRKERDR